jgi:hypothetical protein
MARGSSEGGVIVVKWYWKDEIDVGVGGGMPSDCVGLRPAGVDNACRGQKRPSAVDTSGDSIAQM